MDWISVKDRLPEPGVSVLAYELLGYEPEELTQHFIVGWMAYPKSLGGEHLWYSDDGTGHDVTHWQPLPAPPGGGKEEE